MKVGVLGCMAERLKSQFLEEEKIVTDVPGASTEEAVSCGGGGNGCMFLRLLCKR
jgi:hypothetical protein